MSLLNKNQPPNLGVGIGIGVEGKGKGKRRKKNPSFPAFMAIHVSHEMYDNLPKLQMYYRATSKSHAIRLLIEDKLKEIEAQEKQTLQSEAEVM